MDLKDKVAVITGGASGLGRATAEMVIKNRGKVAIFDSRDLARSGIPPPGRRDQDVTKLAG